MKYLSDYMQDQQTKFFNDTGAFFAFSKTQFSEPRKEGIKYASLSGGMFCPKENAQALIDGLEVIHKEAIKKDFEENGAKAIISREYFNHECQLTHDTSTMINAITSHIEMFPDAFPDELIKQEARKCFN